MTHENLAILIIDDDDMDAEIITKALRKSKQAFDVQYAMTFNQALEHLKKTPFDIALLDLNLPDSNGIDSVHKIARVNPLVPIVVVTGMVDSEIEKTLIASGAQDYLLKDEIGQVDIWRILRHAIDRHHLRAQLEIKQQEQKSLLDAIKSGQIDQIQSTSTPSGVIKLMDADLLAEKEKLLSVIKHQNEQLKEHQVQLTQNAKMASIGQLAAGIAHEINNPISFVLSNVNVLNDYVTELLSLYDAYDNLATQCQQQNQFSEQTTNINYMKKQIDIDLIKEDCEPLMTEVMEGIDRVKVIVNDLKHFSHIDQEELEYADINAGLESALKMVNNELKYKCQISKELSELPDIYCNIGQLNQVFMNILINAGQAIDANGKVTVKTSLVDKKAIISIADTGCGIPQEHLSKLFDPFFTTKPVGTGTGLGLSICYGIIEKHGGTIEVNSKRDQGTEFIISIPITGTK